MIVFGGLGGQLDRESAARIAAAKGLTPKYFDYRDTEAALKYAKGLDRPYESMGFSAGVNSQERFAEEARKRGFRCREERLQLVSMHQRAAGKSFPITPMCRLSTISTRPAKD